MRLLDLPSEIVDAILESGSDTSALKNLRLVCSAFAYYNAVRRQLFRNLYMIADAERAQYFTERAVANSGIAPLVRHVTFVPPLHEVMSYNQFDGIFALQASQGYGCYKGAYSMTLANDRYSLDDALQDPAPDLHTEEQLREGHRRYNHAGQLSREYLQGEHLHAAWTGLLRQFINCRSFRFAAVDYNLIGMDLMPKMPDCITSPISVNGCRRTFIEMHCDIELANAFGTDCLDTVLPCLIESGRKIQRLEFGQARWFGEDDGGSWLQLVDWDRLDLSHLEHLIIEPSTDNEEDDYDSTIALPEAIYDLLQRSAATLQVFDCSRTEFVAWLTPPIALTQLRSLNLGRGVISSNSFCQWLTSLPRLANITIRGLSLRNHVGLIEPDERWGRVWTAVRAKDNIRRGEIVLAHTGGKSMSFRFDKDAQRSIAGQGPVDDSEEAWEQVLESSSCARDLETWTVLYICGKVGYKGTFSESIEAGMRG